MVVSGKGASTHARDADLLALHGTGARAPIVGGKRWGWILMAR